MPAIQSPTSPYQQCQQRSPTGITNNSSVSGRLVITVRSSSSSRQSGHVTGVSHQSSTSSTVIWHQLPSSTSPSGHLASRQPGVSPSGLPSTRSGCQVISHYHHYCHHIIIIVIIGHSSSPLSFTINNITNIINVRSGQRQVSHHVTSHHHVHPTSSPTSAGVTNWRLAYQQRTDQHQHHVRIPGIVNIIDQPTSTGYHRHLAYRHRPITSTSLNTTIPTSPSTRSRQNTINVTWPNA